jgi:16S rRNA (adenine1518-N6/adenine1519-N6)-dimethyltransferase
MIQYYCAATKLFTVPPTAFEPQPKVDSAIIRLAPFQEKPFTAKDELQFSAVVKQAFAHPRKTLRNNLKDLLSDTQTLDVDLSLRPGVLSVEQYVKLANSLL